MPLTSQYSYAFASPLATTLAEATDVAASSSMPKSFCSRSVQEIFGLVTGRSFPTSPPAATLVTLAPASASAEKVSGSRARLPTRAAAMTTTRMTILVRFDEWA